MQPEDAFVVYGLLILVLGVLGFLGWYAITGARRKKESRSSSDSTGLLHDEWVEFGRDKDTLRYNWTTPTKHRLASLTVEHRGRSSGSFRVVGETSFDRVCKLIGFAQEHQTGDGAFDYAHYIQTDVDEFAAAYFADVNRRQAIRELFRIGFTEVTHDGVNFVAKWSQFPRDRATDRSVVDEAARHLATLAHSPPEPEPGAALRVGARKRRRVIRQVIVWILPTILAIAIFGMYSYQPLETWPLVGFSLLFSVPLLLAFLWIAAWLVRGHSTSHRQWLAVFWLSVFVFPIGGYSITANLNGILDEGQPEKHLVPVTGISVSGSKTKRYYAVVRNWRDPSETVELKISLTVFNQVKPNASHAEVTTLPGAFGYEWISRYRIHFVPLPPKNMTTP